jgi:hypothetical protein
MTKTKTTDAATDLRGKIAEIDERRLKLMAERDEISFAAIVEKDKKSIERANAINETLAQLANESAMLVAALTTALKRERETEAAELAQRKRADFEKAESLLGEVDQLARQMDDAMKTLRETSATFEAHWSTIKQLSGSGPTGGALKVFLDRAYRSALRGLPGMEIRPVPPNERHTVSELTAGWSKQVSNVVAAQNKVRILATEPAAYVLNAGSASLTKAKAG